MKKIRHYIEYSFLLLFGFVLRLFPLDVVRYFAVMLADFAFYCIPVRKKVTLDNLSKAFAGVKTHDEIKVIARNAYRQFSKTLFEIIYFPKLDKETILKMVSFENLNLLDDAIKNKKGAVLVGSHFGNWELMGIALSAHYPLTFLVGEQTNKLVDNILNSYRIQKGIKILPLKFALRGVMKVLKSNEFIAIISDQDAHENGAFVDFFGRPASTPKAPAQFALRLGCPIITGHNVRENGKFKVVFNEVKKPELTGNLEKDIENYTAVYTKIIEDYCRRYPDHWFWMHRRWKTRKPIGDPK
jgi:KDO2-lipid IV(A) lauroyltransferase